MTEKLRLSKNETLTYQGQNLKLMAPIILRVQKLQDGATIAARAVQGQRSSDEPQPIAKNTVLSILQKEIDQLERKENALLMSIAEPDPLDFNDELSLGDHLGTAEQIMNLKKVLKKIKAL